MVLTPQVVEVWIKENVCADKDKSTSKRDICSLFHAGLPFISVQEQANFFSFFGFAIKKFANVSVIKQNSRKVGYQGIFLKSGTALNKHDVMEWATTKLAPGTRDDILTKDEVWYCCKIHHGISDERHHEQFLGLFGIAVVGHSLFSSVPIKEKKTFVGLKV